jgi:hypothetical protein
VLLRRKSGRVTDTEWMASNADYAAEIVRFARAKASEDGHADLLEWADKLEKAMTPIAPPRPKIFQITPPVDALTEPPLPTKQMARAATADRYVWGVR